MIDDVLDIVKRDISTRSSIGWYRGFVHPIAK